MQVLLHTHKFYCEQTLFHIYNVSVTLDTSCMFLPLLRKCYAVFSILNITLNLTVLWPVLSSFDIFRSL